MKKITLVFAFISFVFLIKSNAQDINFGVKAGFNGSSLSSASSLGYGSKPGFHLGGVAEIPFSDKIILQPEVLLALQGAGTGLGDDINLFYLSIPFAAKYNVWDKLYVEAGPQLGLLLSDNIDPINTNTLDLGLLIGAGYRLNDNFYFQLRFNGGFINVIEDAKSKNRALQVSAVYFF